ncbi:uncharacterized protein KGF55_004086, partial [Candida pseudojiufengensis]|uniref:uncharacterized protein n=1 Tax=Candida pseudojiufengensis TaxID=497109 RepID=UPI002224A23F
MKHYKDFTCFMINELNENNKLKHVDQFNLSNTSSLQHRLSLATFNLPHRKEKWTIFNVYFQSGINKETKQDQFTAQLEFIKIVEESITRFKNQFPSTKIIIGGDFNNIMDTELDVILPPTTKSYKFKHKEKQLIQEMKRFYAKFQLSDAMRMVFPTAINTTNSGSKTQAKRRLDRFYIGNDLKNRILDYKTVEEVRKFSTHHLITIDIWTKIETSPLIGRPHYTIPQVILNSSNTIKYLNESNYKSDNINNSGVFKNWDNEINFLHAQTTSISHLENQINRIIQRRNNTPVQRELYIEDQHIIKYRVKRKELSIITNLKKEDGSLAKTTNDMLSVATSFWENIYKTKDRGNDFSLVHDFDRNLAIQDITDLERPFTEEELLKHLKCIMKPTSAGIYGLTYKAIHKLWPRLGKLICKVGNEIRESGELPESMKLILIKLIPKKTDSTLEVKNLRPIAIISTSLRLLSSTFQVRCEKVFSKIIHQDQSGFLRNRNINTNTFVVKKILQEMTLHPERSMDQSLLMLDLYKAFDSVNHIFLQKLLHKLKIGKYAFNFLTAISAKHLAQIVINNTRGKVFNLGSGVRQGNPLSPILFNLILETMLNQLNKRLIGATLTSWFRIRYQAFADDVIICLNGTSDLKIANEILKLFEQQSGLLINQKKTELLYYSNPPSQSLFSIEPHPLDLIKFNYLGVPMQNQYSWNHKISQLIAVIYKIPTLDLKFALTIRMMNVFILSKIYYLDLHQPLDKTNIKKLNLAIQNKLPFKISLQKLHKPLRLGGFGLIDLDIQLQGRKAKEIYKLFTDEKNTTTNYLRFRLQQVCLHIFPTVLQNERLRVYPWYHFLQQSTPFQDISFEDIKTRILNQIPDPEKSWFLAWFEMVSNKNVPCIQEELKISESELLQLTTKANPLALEDLVDARD